MIIASVEIPKIPENTSSGKYFPLITGEQTAATIPIVITQPHVAIMKYFVVNDSYIYKHIKFEKAIILAYNFNNIFY